MAVPGLRLRLARQINLLDARYIVSSAHLDLSATVIPAFSKRQVMDWSLVLASQDIAATIIQSDRGWGLHVRPEEYEPALQAIRQYRLENRHWQWRQPIPWSDATFHWGSLGWCLLLALAHWITFDHLPQFRLAGQFATKYAAGGEWWRAFTAILLHADLGHLLANTTIGFLLLGLAMARYGAGIALFSTYLAGATGNLLGLLLSPQPYVGVGASGMVMGALGLIAVPPLRTRPFYLSRQHMSRALLASVFLFLLVGANPASDVVAHTGGFVMGALIGIILNLVPRPVLQCETVSTTTWIVFAGLFAWTAWLALART